MFWFILSVGIEKFGETDKQWDYEWVSDTEIKRIADIPENHYPIDVKGNPNGYYDIKKGDRIAQIVFCEVLTATLEECPDVSVIGVNRNGGFGSSGVK